MLAKFIDEGKREYAEMEIFIKEFRTTNELLLKIRSNLLSELKIEVNELSKVVSNVLIPKNEVKGMTTPGGKMTSEVTRSKEINETGINKNEPPRFKQDILEEACTKTMNERCSAVLLNELPSKEKDPMSFTTPCQVLEKHKEAEDFAANHLSRFENPHMEVLNDREIANKFFDKHLMVLKSKFNNDEPWHADFVNYIVRKVVPSNWTFEKRKRFFSQVKTYFWEDPYAFKLCTDNIMRRCVAGSETLEILAHCHSGPTGGIIVLMLPQRRFMSLDFIGLVSLKMLMKAQALPTNDARVVVKFLRSLFARFGVPKALISDKGAHFCNSQLEKALQRYGVTHKLSTAYHPQSNGQTKVTNRAIKNILERSVGYNPKDFKVGDKVLLYNSRLKMYPGKLKSKWSALNIVKTVYPHGAIEITERDGFSFKVNGQRLKKYYRGNIDKEDDEVIEFENGVT
ncbi:reverse transcriptase domain-containing protein [Tanacetum coccineum]